MKCLNPIFIRKGNLSVPCGKCVACRENLLNSWTARLLNEVNSSLTAYFFTLTFNDENYPVENTENKAKLEIQQFFKRLRRKIEIKFNQDDIKPIKYYAVGEYGNQTKRFHFHALIYNIPGSMVASQKLVEDTWGNGFVHIGKVQPGSVKYILDYLIKNEDSMRLISKGLGVEYVTENKIKFHQDNLNCQVTTNGFKYPMHRYYKDRIFTQEQKKKIVESFEYVDSLELELKANYLRLKNDNKKLKRKL